MRLALVTPGFSASEEDWCIPALLNLVRELAEHHEVYVLALRYPPRRGRYQVHGATVEALGGAQARGLRRLPLGLRGIRCLVREGRGKPFDVLHGLWAHEPGWVVSQAGRILKTPAMVSLLGGELAALPDIGYGGQLSWTNRHLTAVSLKHASLVTVGSRSQWDEALATVPGDRLRVLPLGVDQDLFTPGSRPSTVAPLQGERRLLQVASLSPVKDPITMLEAFSPLARRDPGLHLHLVGEGVLRQAIEARSVELSRSSQVTLHGAVAHDRLPTFYRAADLCVLTSRFESQGMVVLEAAACACPTVGTAVGILPEITPSRYLVAPGDSAALTQVLETCLQELAETQRLGQEVRDRVVASFGLGSTVDGWCEAYAGIASAASTR